MVPTVSELGTKDQEHHGGHNKEGQADGQHQCHAPDLPPGAPFLHIIGPVQCIANRHDRTGGGPERRQNPEGEHAPSSAPSPVAGYGPGAG
jgi:hypothetical protein